MARPPSMLASLCASALKKSSLDSLSVTGLSQKTDMRFKVSELKGAKLNHGSYSISFSGAGISGSGYGQHACAEQ